jgi:hypothetical protein
VSLVRNSKGIGSRGDLFFANLFPMDVSRRVYTFEVPGPELKGFWWYHIRQVVTGSGFNPKVMRDL